MREELIEQFFGDSSGRRDPHNSSTLASNSSNSTDDSSLHVGTLIRNAIYITTGILVSFITFFGNVLVIIAFIRDRKLHRTSNYYIISLATADMIIGFMSIPLFTVYMVTDLQWPLGFFICNFWLQVDYALCYTSLLSIFLICIDRYWSVSNSVHYINNFTKQKAIMLILPTWILPQVLFFLLVWLYPYFVPGTPEVPEDQCYVPYAENVTLNVVIAVVSFWVPLFIIIVLYIQIYRVAKRLSKRSQQQKILINSSEKAAGAGNSAKTRASSKCQIQLKPMKPPAPPEVPTIVATNGIELCPPSARSINNINKNNNVNKININNNNNNNGRLQSLQVNGNLGGSPQPSISVCASNNPQGGEGGSSKSQTASKNWRVAIKAVQFSQPKDGTNSSSGGGSKHIKALKMLSSILACYVICWAPFSCLVMVLAKCPTCTPLWLYNISYGLCYINSTINPFCYAYANVDFRRVVVELIKKLFCCCSKNRNSIR